MGKLNIVVKDAPATRVRESKYTELLEEIAAAFEGLSVGQCFEINVEDVPASTLQAKVRKLIKFRENEDLRISKLTKEDNGSDKVYATRLTKTTKLTKPAQPASSDSQGKAEDFN